MIATKEKVNTVTVHVYGEPIIKDIKPPVEKTVRSNLSVPTELQYNGSWKVEHQCLNCKEKIAFGEEFDGWKKWERSYYELEPLYTKNYNTKILKEVSGVFNGTHVITSRKNNTSFVVPRNFEDADAETIFIPKLTVLYYYCKACGAEYLCRFRQGFPVEPDRGNPRGYPGTIYIDDIVWIQPDNGKSFLDLIPNRGVLSSFKAQKKLVKKDSKPAPKKPDTKTGQTKITWSELLKIVPEEPEDCDDIYQKYQAWRKLDTADDKRMVYLGSLVPDNPDQVSSLKEFPSFEQYWSKEAPIALAYYPYYGCEVYRLKSCSSLYLIYTEFAGHAPEKRCRLLQKRLIQTPDA